jgi:hypothetical protein
LSVTAFNISVLAVGCWASELEATRAMLKRERRKIIGMNQRFQATISCGRKRGHRIIREAKFIRPGVLGDKLRSLTFAALD